MGMMTETGLPLCVTISGSVKIAFMVGDYYFSTGLAFVRLGGSR